MYPQIDQFLGRLKYTSNWLDKVIPIGGLIMHHWLTLTSPSDPLLKVIPQADTALQALLISLSKMAPCIFVIYFTQYLKYNFLYLDILNFESLHNKICDD